MNGLGSVHGALLKARLSENRQSFVKLVKTDHEKEESLSIKEEQKDYILFL